MNLWEPDEKRAELAFDVVDGNKLITIYNCGDTVKIHISKEGVIDIDA